MAHIKIAVFVTSENQNIQSHIEKTTQKALHSLGAVNIVEDDSWDYLLRYTAVEKVDEFVEIQVKYNYKMCVMPQTSDGTNMTVDDVDWGVFQIPIEELPEFCQQQAQTFTKWRRRWGLGQAHVLAFLERRES